jgi:hypothetical protein
MFIAGSIRKMEAHHRVCCVRKTKRLIVAAVKKKKDKTLTGGDSWQK